MENLDISWFNNSGITEKANMQYAFGNNSDTPEGAMTSLKYITVGNNFKLTLSYLIHQFFQKEIGKSKEQKNKRKTQN